MVCYIESSGKGASKKLELGALSDQTGPEHLDSGVTILQLRLQRSS